MFSIISSFFIPAVAQNADACVFWKLTFNRDFRSTEFQEIKINSCPALAASWGQCLLRGVLGTTEILGWKSSSRLASLCPPTTYTISKQAAWTHCCFSLHMHTSLSNFFSYTLLVELLQIIIFIVVIYKGKLNSFPSVLGTMQIQHLSPKHTTTEAYPSVCNGTRALRLHLLVQG